MLIVVLIFLERSQNSGFLWEMSQLKTAGN